MLALRCGYVEGVAIVWVWLLCGCGYFVGVAIVRVSLL